MPWIAGGATVLTGILGGLFGNSAQSAANKANVKLAAENRAFQEKMANTAYQRGTADMIKAGLNPMLAASRGGADTPATSAATVEPVDSLARNIGGLNFNSAKLLAAQADAAKAQAFKTRQEGIQEEVKANKAVTETIGGGDQAPSIQDTRWARERDEADRVRLAKEMEQLELRIKRALETATVTSGKQAAELATKEVSIAEFRRQLEQLKIPEAKAMAKWFEEVGALSPAAKATMSIGQWLLLMFGRK